MHPTILAKRSGLAQQRMLAAAEKLASEFGLDANMITALRVQSGDPDVRRMLEREAVADVLEALAQTTVSVETVNVPQSENIEDAPVADVLEAPVVAKAGKSGSAK